MAKLAKILYSLLMLLLLLFCLKSESGQRASSFEYQISPISPQLENLMRQYTWHEGCPVPIEDLVYVKLSYWGFDHEKHYGELIVNSAIVNDVVAIFKDLYEQKFPIERMQLIETFKGDDHAAMLAGNTSAFNCRPIRESPQLFSQHSYGWAIDINPRLNPSVNGKFISPPNGRDYLDRSKSVPGMIVKNDKTYEAFIKRGWHWGGVWAAPHDYQHFEKPLNTG